LKLVEAEFNYIKNLAGVFHVYRAYRADPNWESFGLLEKKINERKEVIDSIFKTSINNLVYPFGGGTGKKELYNNGTGPATLTSPFNWDFAFLREKKVLPGTLKKSVYAYRANKITLDGELNEPEWQKANFETLEEISMGPVKNETKFKVLYDDEALYLAFVCKSDRITEIAKIEPVGKDGQAYYQEAIEIMLDPFGTREKHYHMIFNPVPDSRFDSKWGFITDTLDPRYGKRDDSWDGHWTYVAKIDIDKNQWTAEVRIPYETLEVSKPSEGTVWAMNIGREEWPEGFGKNEPILSLWSPNLETRSFHDRRTFGEVIFR